MPLGERYTGTTVVKGAGDQFNDDPNKVADPVEKKQARDDLQSGGDGVLVFHGACAK